MTFDEIISPLTREQFFKEYKGKKHFTIRSERPIFDYLFDWEQFDEYCNSWGIGGHDRMPQLQVVEEKGKWCKKKDAPKYIYSKTENPKYQARSGYLAWKNGHSFILAISEFLNKEMWNQCEEFEKVYGRGQANLYCSGKKDADVFTIHADSTDNFLLHVEGQVKWNMYNEWSPHKGEFTLRESFVLSPGDLLYIPKGMYHNTETLSPRISISFHFHEPDGFHKKREEWLDWRP